MTAAWLAAMWAASMRGGIALLAAWGLAMVPTVPARVRCWVWRAAYAVLLVSLVWTTPVSLAWRAAVMVPQAMAPAAVAVEDSPGLQGGGAVVAAAAPATTRVDWAAIGLGLWFAFLGVYAGWLAVGWERARRLRRGPAVDAPELAELCRSMGIVRPPAVRVSAMVRGPLLVGGIHPTIMLPESLVEVGERRLVLAHELAHLARRDLLWNWMPTLALAALPWHPLVWIGNRQWRLAVESACDAEAVAASGSGTNGYGRMLVKVATAAMPVGSNVLAVAAGAESKWLLKRRLAAMRKIKTWSRRRLGMAGAAIAGCAVLAAVPWRVVAQSRSVAQSAQSSTQPVAERGAGLQTSSGALVLPKTAAAKETLTAFGTITANNAILRTTVAGTVETVSAQPGDLVRQGQEIAKLDSQSQADALALEKKISETSEKRLAFVQQLFSKGLGTEGDVMQAELDSERAQDVLLQRKQQLQARQIVAPFAGRLGLLSTGVGSTVMPGDTIAILTGNEDSHCAFSVAQDEAGTIKVGSRVVLHSSRDGTVIGQGVVVSAVTAIDPQTGSGRVEARIERSSQAFWPGEFVTVSWEAK